MGGIISNSKRGDVPKSPEEKKQRREIIDLFLKHDMEKAELSHGYSSCLLECVLEIDERVHNIPQSFRTGIFQHPRSFPGIVRINTTPPAAARMSVRIEIPRELNEMDSLDENLSRNDEKYFIDFLLAEGLKEFLFKDQNELLSKELMDEPGENFIYKLQCPLILYDEIEHGIKPLNNSIGYCGKEYYGGLPFRLGETGACKWGIKPKQEHPLHNDDMVGGKPTNNINLIGKDKEAAEIYKKSLQSFLDANPGGGAAWDFVIQIAPDERYEYTSMAVVYSFHHSSIVIIIIWLIF